MHTCAGTDINANPLSPYFIEIAFLAKLIINGTNLVNTIDNCFF